MFFCKIKIIFGKTNLRNDLQNYKQFIFLLFPWRSRVTLESNSGSGLLKLQIWSFITPDPELPWSLTF